MIDATVKQDVYKHLKNDDGTFPLGGERSAALEPDESRALYALIGLDDVSTFHLHVYPYALAEPVEEHLPTIEFVVRPLDDDDVTKFMNFRIDFRLLSTDATHTELDALAGRIFMLMTADARPLWNAEPPGDRYPRAIERRFDTGNVASLEMSGVIGRMMSFAGGVGPHKNIAGQRAL